MLRTHGRKLIDLMHGISLDLHEAIVSLTLNAARVQPPRRENPPFAASVSSSVRFSSLICQQAFLPASGQLWLVKPKRLGAELSLMS
jgi:hypothetical protein